METQDAFAIGEKWTTSLLAGKQEAMICGNDRLGFQNEEYPDSLSEKNLHQSRLCAFVTRERAGYYSRCL